MMNKTNYKQYDTRWGGLPYPRRPHYIRVCGCGEVAIANCIVEMSKYAKYTPKTIQPYCKQYADPNGNGTYWSGIPKMMVHYGMTEVKEHANMKSLWKELAKGNRVAVYLMGTRRGGSKGVHWTSCGHFVCSVAYKVKDGKHYLYVKDSNSTSSLRNGWITYEGNMANDIVKVWSGKLPTESKKTTTTTKPKKTIDQIAQEVIDGKWGNGDERISKLKKAGYDPDAVQKKVNEILKKKDEPKPKPKVKTPQEKICAEAKKIAKSGKYRYVKYTEKYGGECAICHPHNGKNEGWQCIGYAIACWHHSGIKCKCKCDVFTDQIYNKMLKMSLKDAKKVAKERLGINTVTVIRNGGKAIPFSKLQPGDIIAYFSGNNYRHTAIYVGNGKIADCTSGRKPNIKYGVSSYKSLTIKLAIRYTGK